MFVHVVCWKVKDGAEGMAQAEIASKMKAMLDVLPSKIDVIKDFQVGIDELRSDRSFDVSLYSVFENESDFKTYQTHPDHQVVVDFFKKVVEKAVAVDYLK